MNLVRHLLLAILLINMVSCGIYRQDIMFQGDPSEFKKEVERAERNYLIQKNDFLRINVFTNNGEQIVDPNFQFGIGQGGPAAGNANFQNQQFRNQFTYLVQQDGNVKLPIVGKVLLENMTIDQAESHLETLYSEYYKDSFVKLEFINNRVVVLGAAGGQVIPLPNQNTSLVEVVALAGGINFGARATNVKVIRNGLDDPDIFQVDLSKASEISNGLMIIEPGDVVYIEPWRREWLQVLRDISPAMSVVSSVITLYIVLTTL